MLEKRIIGKKTFYVNIIEKDDGTIIEQYLDDYLTELQQAKLKEEKDKLKREKEKLKEDILAFKEEKAKWKKMNNDAEYGIDVLESNPNFYSTCTEEEKEAYNYLKNNKLRSTSKDMYYLLRSSKWKYTVYPRIKEEKERLERRRKSLEEERHEFKKKLAQTLIVSGVFILLILGIVGCAMFS